MKTQDSINYNRIADAIEYIQEHFTSQPNLEEIAGKIHVSPFHFQRLFTDWAGTSPKKFLQYLSVEHAKKLLKENKLSLTDASIETGLSGTGRLHDLFIQIEGMTPGEYKNGGKNLDINYSFAETPFGTVMIASTPKGICQLSFTENEKDGLEMLLQKFPAATFHQKTDMMQQQALFIFTQDWKKLSQLKLHLKGTAFQLKVWEALLKIPMGGLTTYGNIADAVGNTRAARAVGSAIGDNPVAFLIPCHRVIQSTGKIGDYMWGSTRKKAIIGWESARVNQ